MKQQLETAGGMLPPKLSRGTFLSKINRQELFENVCLFLLCRICFAGYLVSPFGIAFYAALFFKRKRISYPVFALAGILSVAYPTFALKYIGAIAIISTVALIFKRELTDRRMLCCLLPAGALFLNGSVYVIAEGFFAYDMLMLLSECGVTYLSGIAYLKTVDSVPSLKTRTRLEASEIVSFVFVCGTVVLSLALTEPLLPVAHIPAITVILALSYACGYSVSCPAGALFGLCLGLAGGYSAQTVCVYCLASFFSGLAKRYGKVGVSISFLLSGFAATVLLCPETNGIITAAYVAIASLILFMIPDSFLRKFGVLTVEIKEEDLSKKRIRQTVETRIADTVSAMDSVGSVLKNVLADISEDSINSHNAVFDNTAGAVCANCSLYQFCWRKERKETMEIMEQMFHIMERKNTISKADIPEAFTDMCIRRDAFVTELNKNYEAFKITRMWAGRVAESKRLVAEQFKNVSMILQNMQDNLKEELQFEPELESRIASALERRGISASHITVCGGDGFSVTMDSVSCGEKRVCATQVASALSEVLEVPMLRENRECGTDICHLKFSQQTRFLTDIATASATQTHSTGTGDSALCFPCGNGKVALVLSDGCGSGEQAHFLSSITTNLAKNLLSAGFDKETCVRLINNILMMNADRDTFATIDLAIINLYTGTMEFVKSGSANSYIKTKSGTETVYATSLPAGLMHGLEPDYDMRYMQSGDYLIMVSDGITDILDTADKNEIFSLAEGFTGSAQTLADRILAEALNAAGGTAYDDMTVFVCAVSENM